MSKPTASSKSLRKIAPWTYQTTDGIVITDTNYGTRHQNSSRWIAERDGKIVTSAPTRHLVLVSLGRAI